MRRRACRRPIACADRRLILRDVLLREVPTVLRHDLDAIPALRGAGVLVAAKKSGMSSPVLPVLGAAVCVGVRLARMPERAQRTYGMTDLEQRLPRQGDRVHEPALRQACVA
jgi:hypothetical protein